MSVVQTIDTKTELSELSATAMEAFCQDIRDMFDVKMACLLQDGCIESIAGLKKRFPNITAIISAAAKGHLAGTFHIIFDQEGMFTLAGVFVMQPKQKILENRKEGTLKEAEDIRDAMKEGGNLLIGSWNRICIDKWGNSNHLLQSGTFIGNPWNKPRESMNAAENDEFLYIPCEMTMGSFPAFKCGIIFPKEIRKSLSPDGTEESQVVEEEKPQPPAAASEPVEEKKPAAAEPKATTEPKAASESKKPAAAEKQSVSTPEKSAEIKEKPSGMADSKAASHDKAPAAAESQSAPAAVPAAIPASGEKPKESILSKTILNLTGRNSEILWTLCAKDIMRKNVIWCESEESVEQVRIKMDQNDVGYVIVGAGGIMEGIIARSDLAGAISPYLRPVFSQWRRPLDDASLQIKVKWIMSRPVHIVRPEKPLAVVMENMCRFHVRALPVVNQKGEVEGLITVFDIFSALLQKNEEVLTAVKTV